MCGDRDKKHKRQFDEGRGSWERLPINTSYETGAFSYTGKDFNVKQIMSQEVRLSNSITKRMKEY